MNFKHTLFIWILYVSKWTLRYRHFKFGIPCYTVLIQSEIYILFLKKKISVNCVNIIQELSLSPTLRFMSQIELLWWGGEFWGSNCTHVPLCFNEILAVLWLMVQICNWCKKTFQYVFQFTECLAIFTDRGGLKSSYEVRLRESVE